MLLLILVIIVKVKELKVVGYDVIGFGVGEFDFNMLQYILEVVVIVMNDGQIKYMLVGGFVLLKEVVIEKFKCD